VDQTFVNYLIGALGFCIAWWINNIWGMVKMLQQEVSNLHVELTKNYVPRVELEKNFERIFKAQEDANKMMFAGFEDMRKEIAHISRNQATTRGLAEAVANLRRQE
jgi:hypothetical protein